MVMHVHLATKWHTTHSTRMNALSKTLKILLNWDNFATQKCVLRNGVDLYADYQEYIIGKEGEYPTLLWYCVTTLYGGHDLCNVVPWL